MTYALMRSFSHASYGIGPFSHVAFLLSCVVSSEFKQLVPAHKEHTYSLSALLHTYLSPQAGGGCSQEASFRHTIYVAVPQLHGTAFYMTCFSLHNVCGTLAQEGTVNTDVMRQCHSNINCTLLPVTFQRNSFQAQRHTQVPNLGEMPCTYHSTH